MAATAGRNDAFLISALIIIEEVWIAERIFRNLYLVIVKLI